jgi:hypothetical protein
MKCPFNLSILLVFLKTLSLLVSDLVFQLLAQELLLEN